MATSRTFALDENFISTDVGNGWAACYRRVNGKIKSHGIPHARARVTGAKLNSDMGSQNVAEYADFMGQRYGYGDGIWNLTDAPIDLHQNTARRYGGQMQLVPDAGQHRQHERQIGQRTDRRRASAARAAQRGRARRSRSRSSTARAGRAMASGIFSSAPTRSHVSTSSSA